MNRPGSPQITRVPTRAAAFRWWTLANALTGARLVAAPVCAAAIATRLDLLAALLFAVAVATDLADGRVARRRGESTPLGGLLDHATDATFAALTLAALAWQGAVPAPLPLLVAVSFLQYVLDSRASAARPLRASSLGRWNGIAYFALLGIPLAQRALVLSWPGRELVLAAGWLLVASTVVSMADRLLAHRRASPGH